jgi:hypothetical protein
MIYPNLAISKKIF